MAKHCLMWMIISDLCSTVDIYFFVFVLSLKKSCICSLCKLFLFDIMLESRNIDSTINICQLLAFAALFIQDPIDLVIDRFCSL